MHNFLTYADAEVRPGPRLNVVVGPNGSGKSTILCAIALGLGSSANALERGDGVGCFVMRDKEKGWMEIELKGKREGDPTIVIRRDLERASNRSSYKLNGEVATQALVHQKVQELGIQVNNLCTFLPQEKVGKFTEMDPQKLLMETEKVVCTESFDLFSTHEDLIARQRYVHERDVCVGAFTFLVFVPWVRDKPKGFQSRAGQLVRSVVRRCFDLFCVSCSSPLSFLMEEGAGQRVHREDISCGWFRFLQDRHASPLLFIY